MASPRGIAISHAPGTRRSGVSRDLKARGLFDTTLVMWGGEFGRNLKRSLRDSGFCLGSGRCVYRVWELTANGESSAHARALNAFMTTLALCHTAIAGVNEDNSLSYKAQSPDESALVQAAADSGYIFLGKEKDILRLKTPFLEGDAVEEYELLHVLDFTSARKRMSVILRKVATENDSERKLLLLSKGADSVIIEWLSSCPRRPAPGTRAGNRGRCKG